MELLILALILMQIIVTSIMFLYLRKIDDKISKRKNLHTQIFKKPMEHDIIEDTRIRKPIYRTEKLEKDKLDEYFKRDND